MRKILSVYIAIMSITLIVFTTPVYAKIAPYERMVGLGNCCVTRRQIDHHLCNRFPGVEEHDFGGGQLFDWVQIRDYRLLAKAIEGNLSDIMEEQDFNGLINVRYNICWIHLFSSWDDLVRHAEFPDRKEKIEYLAQKFRDLEHYRTLYIVAFPHTFSGQDGFIKPDEFDLLRLSNAIEKMRGNRNFTVLYCPDTKKFKSFGRVKVVELKSSTVPHEGNHQLWNGVLDKFGFKLSI